MVNVYKGKRDTLEYESYGLIKLLDRVMEVRESVIEKEMRSNDMRFGSRPGRGTTEEIFNARKVQEKKKDLWMAFVNL